jgi:tRNA A-37 threonylcarbamoyl transferase component Bud32
MNNLIGQTLGQYEIIKMVGQGGMATVFQARQPGLNRDVALKVLPPNVADQPGFTERFVREAQAIGNLHHPNILPVYDTGRDKGYAYIVMRYIPNATTLADAMKNPLSPRQITRLTGQIASALDLAHHAGMVHRDVKPGNILMDGDWALLSDFGLAKMVESSVNLTGSGVGLGTPAYMSPEQAKAEKVDHHTDQYALAVIVYEMLTGQVPHQAETPLGTVVKRLSQPITPPRQLNPAIPSGVEAVLLKALSPQPQDRYYSAGQFARVLEAAFAASPKSFSRAATPLPAALPSEATAAPASGGLSTAEWLVIGVLGLFSLLGISGGIFALRDLTDLSQVALLPMCLSMPVAGISTMVMLWLRKRTGITSVGLVLGLAAWLAGILTLGFGLFTIINPSPTNSFTENFAISTALCLLPGVVLALSGLAAYGFDFRRKQANPAKTGAAAAKLSPPERRLDQKLRRAVDYHKQINRLIKQKQGSSYAAQLTSISASLNQWETHLRQLVVRVQNFQTNQLVQHDLVEVPAAINRLQTQLEQEADPHMRQEIREALTSYQAHQTQLDRLVSLIRRTEFDIDETLSAIGALHSQLQMLDVKGVDNSRAARLSVDITEQSARLSDLLSAMDDVYQDKESKSAAF